MALIPLKHYATLLAGTLLLFVSGTALAGPGAVTEVELASPQSGPAQSTPVQQQVVALEVLPSAPDTGEYDTALGVVEALELALANHPGIAALDKEYWALDSIAWQAGRKPNPGLELEFGDFGGTADSRGVRVLDSSLTYSQPIERGGKRTKRKVALALKREIVLWDIAGLEHQIQAEVKEATLPLKLPNMKLTSLSSTAAWYNAFAMLSRPVLKPGAAHGWSWSVSSSSWRGSIWHSKSQAATKT